jgi:membrane protease subunit HflC
MAQVGFSRMAFAPQIAPSVYARMVADLNKKALAYQQDGLAQANIIIAEGSRDADQERQLGLQKAAQTRGEGDAEANKMLAEVLTTPESREFYKYVKDLEYAKSTFSKNTVLILPSDSLLIKNLFNPPTVPAAAPKPAGQ